MVLHTIAAMRITGEVFVNPHKGRLLDFGTRNRRKHTLMQYVIKLAQARPVGGSVFKVMPFKRNGMV